MPCEDAINRRMLDEWYLPEGGIDQAVVCDWLKGIYDSLLWSRYLYWMRHLGLDGAGLCSIEAGCGYGKFSMALGFSGVETTLLDYKEETLKTALKLHRSIGLSPRAVVQDLLSTEDDLAGRFDIACSIGTLEHFSGAHRLAAFRSHVRFLRPGGLLLLLVPNKNAYFYRLAFAARRSAGLFPPGFFEQPYSKGELRRFARCAGIEPLEISSLARLKEDFNIWIMDNLRSAYRKMFRITKRDGRSARASCSLDALDPSNASRDIRTAADKHFTYPLLFAGLRQLP